MIPETTRQRLLDAMERFDQERRQTREWEGWEQRANHRYAISHEGRRYPVKAVISMATGFPTRNFSGGAEANGFIHRYGFTVISLGRKDVSSRREIIQSSSPPITLTANTACADDCFAKSLVGFTFEDICNASPPDTKGVYVIRVKSKGVNPKDVVNRANSLVTGLKWPAVQKYILDRIGRIDKIGDCSVIYIGRAGAKKTRNTLKGRYLEFQIRHTAMYPLWALLYHGWVLEYGWKSDEDPEAAEAELKRQYALLHQGQLPALVER